MDEILIIQTGGNIDLELPHNDPSGQLVVGEPAAKRILNKLRPGRSILSRIETLKKDDLKATADERLLYEKIKDSSSKRIVVTHEVTTLPDIAMQLAMQHIFQGATTLMSKTIVFVGSHFPERFQNSDADFNLGVAIGAVQVLGPGVYVAMNGCVFEWDKVQRDDDGLFVPRRKKISFCI